MLLVIHVHVVHGVIHFHVVSECLVRCCHMSLCFIPSQFTSVVNIWMDASFVNIFFFHISSITSISFICHPRDRSWSARHVLAMDWRWRHAKSTHRPLLPQQQPQNALAHFYFFIVPTVPLCCRLCFHLHLLLWQRISVHRPVHTARSHDYLLLVAGAS